MCCCAFQEVGVWYDNLQIEISEYIEHVVHKCITNML